MAPLAIAMVLGATMIMVVGCAADEAKKKEEQAYGESFATGAGTVRDPAILNGEWVGQAWGGDVPITLRFVVNGNSYTGEFETGHGVSGTIAGKITGARWQGTATQLKPVGPYEFSLGGMFSAESISWEYSGKGFFGEESGTGYGHKTD